MVGTYNLGRDTAPAKAAPGADGFYQQFDGNSLTSRGIRHRLGQCTRPHRGRTMQQKVQHTATTDNIVKARSNLWPDTFDKL